MAAKKSATKKAAKKATTKTAAAKKTAAKKTTAKKTAAKSATKKAASKAPAKKAATKKTAQKSAASADAATKKTAKKAPEKKAAKSTLDKKFLDAQRTLLLEERERYTKSAQTWKDEADSLVESREPGDVQFDEESGEGDSLAVERERDLALSAAARAAVEEIDAALGRIEDGSYGVCIASGKPIPKERLKAIPWAAERVEYKAGGFRRR